MIPSQRVLSRALTAVLQCRGLSSQCGDAAASLAALPAHSAFLEHKLLNGQPLEEQQHQQQCSTQQQLWSNSLWGTSQHSLAMQALRYGHKLVDCNTSTILRQLDRSLQQCLQLGSTQLQQQAPQQQQEQQQHMQPKQQGTFSLQPFDSQLLDLPAVQLPLSGDESGPQPLLCIKRTYQPHPKRYKRKHGFLKR